MQLMRTFFKQLFIFFKTHPWLFVGLIATVLLSFLLASLAEKLPFPKDLETLINILRVVYRQHGYWIVLVSGLVEAIIFVNWYFPGSIAILMGGLFSAEGILSLPVVIVIAVTALSAGSLINYFIGCYGLIHVLLRFGIQASLEKAKRRLSEYGFLSVLPWYIHPQLASFVSTACGILGIPLPRFLMLNWLSFLFWGVVWGVLVYAFGIPLLYFLERYYLAVLVGGILGWILVKSKTENEDPHTQR